MLNVSHIQYKVDDIHKAVQEFRDAGFQVEWGRRPEKADNALIWFEEGPFIELFEMSRLYYYCAPLMSLMYGKTAKSRWVHWYRSKEGWCDFALEAADQELVKKEHIQEIQSFTEKCGANTSKIINGSRTKTDGEVVKYAYFTTKPLGLPFVVSSYIPKQRPDSIAHPNGALGVTELNVQMKEGLIPIVKAMTKGDSILNVVGGKENKLLSVKMRFHDNAEIPDVVKKIFYIEKKE